MRSPNLQRIALFICNGRVRSDNPLQPHRYQRLSGFLLSLRPTVKPIKRALFRTSETCGALTCAVLARRSTRGATGSRPVIGIPTALGIIWSTLRSWRSIGMETGLMQAKSALSYAFGEQIRGATVKQTLNRLCNYWNSCSLSKLPCFSLQSFPWISEHPPPFEKKHGYALIIPA